MELDTIIIGSGMGGLSSAICLSRSGQKVMVLEQHDVPGGWCHSFYLNGYRFTPGVHYMGLLGKDESTRELYEGLGIANDLVFFKMNPAAYEHCWIGDERIDMPAGFNELIESLSNRFPNEKKGITKYLEIVRKVSNELHLIPKMNGFWDNITIPWRTRNLGRYGLFSLKTVIDWENSICELDELENYVSEDQNLWLLKLDVEASEYNILENSTIIKKFKYLMIEWHHHDRNYIYSFITKHLPQYNLLMIDDPENHTLLELNQ